MELNKPDVSLGLGAVIGLVILFMWRKTKTAVLAVFGGSLDKSELAGVTALALLVYMVVKEGQRPQQWQLYSDLYILIVSSLAAAGLGLKHVLSHLQKVKRLSSQTETKIEVTETEKTEVKNEQPLP